MSTIVRKLSVKAVAGRIGTIEKDEKRVVARITGIAESFKMVETPYDPAAEFKGRFGGINIETGEAFESSRLFLPSVAADLLTSQINASEGEPVQFGFDIIAEHSDKGNQGYAFSLKPFMESERSDPLAALMAEAQKAAVPKLAGPKGKKGDEGDKDTKGAK